MTERADLGGALRSALRAVPTGVALLTVGPTATATGMVVNSVVSVSLDPALVLVSVHRDSRTLRPLLAARRFGVNFLNARQRWIAERFVASSRPCGPVAVRALGGECGAGGEPLVSDALCALECELENTYPAGDHRLLLGRVVAVRHGDPEAEPLVFHRSDYTTVAPSPSARPKPDRSVTVPSSTLRTEICVIGGGPAGLLLALLMAWRGQHVVVLEKREELRAAPPISPLLHPPTLRLLERAGVLGELLAEGQRITGVSEYGPEGLTSAWAYRDVPGCPFPYSLSVPLSAFNRVLLDAVGRESRITVRAGVTVTGLTQDGGGRYGVLAERDSAAFEVAPGYVVASDGKFSSVRGMAGIDAEVFEFDVPLLQFIAPRPRHWPAEMKVYRQPSANAWTMPIAGGDQVVMWLATPEEVAGLGVGDVRELANRVTAAVPALAEVMAGITRWEQVVDIHHHVLQPRVWHQANLVLLGDSAHGMHSLGGQGLNMSLQDAVLLAEVLDRAIAEGNAGQIAEYEMVRKPFVEHFQQFQMSLPTLSSHPRSPRPGQGPPPSLVEVMALGQEELRPLYTRLRQEAG